MFKSLGHQLNCITIVQNSSFFIVQKGCKLLSEQYSWRLKVWPFPAAVLQIWFLSWLFDYSLPITYPCTATSCHFNLMSVYFFHFYVHLILHVCFFFSFSNVFFFTWHFIPFILLSSAVPFQMNPSDADIKENILN